MTTSPRQSASSRAEKYREYFQRLINELRERHKFTQARAGQPQNWYSFPSGHSGITYGASFGHLNRLRAELYIGTPDLEENKRLFDKLETQKSTIEREFGGELEWESLEEKIACRIAVYREGSIDNNPEALKDIHEWHIQNLLTLKKTFGPRLGVLLKEGT